MALAATRSRLSCPVYKSGRNSPRVISRRQSQNRGSQDGRCDDLRRLPDTNEETMVRKVRIHGRSPQYNDCNLSERSVHLLVPALHGFRALCLEVISRRWGYGYGYETFISNRRNHDVADSLALFWCEKTEAILKFERCGEYKCLPVKYESLATHPEDTSRQLFGFLRVIYDESIVARVFSAKHQSGPGDPKILRTNRIHGDSIGSGRKIDAQRISSTTKARMNSLLTELGYEQVGSSWNV